MSVAEEYGFNFESEPCEKFLVSRFPCRKCLPCLRRRQQEWVARLTEELRQYECNYFLTFTYEDSYLPADDNGLMCFDHGRIIKLHRDLRKRYQQGYFTNPLREIEGMPEKIPLPKDQKIKYYLTSEYCPTSSHRPHYHAVYYNLGIDQWTAECLFRTLWKDGFITCLPAWEGSAGYISKYLVKDESTVGSYNDPDQESPFAIMSKGLGKSYIDRMKDWHRSDVKHRQYFQYHGEKKVLSRYYKHKLFTDEEREEFYNSYMKQQNDLHMKYIYFQQDHPYLYERLMQERAKYFQDQRESEKWNNLKKHNLK